jgi:hypothetical protein
MRFALDIEEWLFHDPLWPIVVVLALLAEAGLYLLALRRSPPPSPERSDDRLRLLLRRSKVWSWGPLWLVDVLVPVIGQFYYFDCSAGVFSAAFGFAVFGLLAAYPFILVQIWVSHKTRDEKLLLTGVTTGGELGVSVVLFPLWLLTHLAP